MGSLTNLLRVEYKGDYSNSKIFFRYTSLDKNMLVCAEDITEENYRVAAVEWLIWTS